MATDVRTGGSGRENERGAPRRTALPTEGRRAFVAAGGILALLGAGAIAFPYVSGIGISIGLGAVLVVSAFVYAGHAFSAHGWMGRVWQVILALVSAAAGISLLTNPAVGLTTLTVLLAAYLVVGGFFEMFLGAMVRGRPGLTVVASGALGVVFGALVWAGLPSSATWALGLLVGVKLLASGLTIAYIGLAASDEPAESVPVAGAA